MDELVSALAGCGDAAAVRALGRDWRHRPVLVRVRIVETLGKLTEDSRGRAISPQVRHAADAVLAAALSDDEEENSLRGGPDGKTLRDPAVGDLAAEALVQRWGRPQLFDVYGRQGVRERQRREVRNVWLKQQGKEPEPAPAATAVEPAPEAKLRPLLRAVREATTDSERRDALAAVEALGLPGLPGVRGLLAAAPDDPGRADVEATARRMAWIVREASFGAESVALAGGQKKTVEALVGKPITTAAFLDLLRSATTARPAGSLGVNITLERMGDDSGVRLTVAFLPDEPACKGLSPQWTIREKVLRGDEALDDSTCGLAGIGRGVGVEEIDWGGFQKSLEKAWHAGPAEYVLVRVSCAEMR